MHFQLYLTSIFILISASSLASSHGQLAMKSRRLQNPGSIALPNLVPKIHENCRTQSVCDVVPNYPKAYIDYLLKHNDSARKTVFLTGGLDKPENCMDHNKDDNYVEVCLSEIKPFEAKAGRDINSGRWYFIVGGWLCVEICKNPNTKCSMILTAEQGYETTCIQKVIKKKLAVLDEHGAIKIKKIDTPCSCCCQVRHASAWMSYK